MGDLGTKLIRSMHATKKEGSFGTFNTCFQVPEPYIATFSNELKAWNAITRQS